MVVCKECFRISLSIPGRADVLASKLLVLLISTLTNEPPKVSVSIKLPSSGRSAGSHVMMIGSFPVLATKRTSHSVTSVVVGCNEVK